jgi:hypothetical protein
VLHEKISCTTVQPSNLCCVEEVVVLRESTPKLKSQIQQFARTRLKKVYLSAPFPFSASESDSEKTTAPRRWTTTTSWRRGRSSLRASRAPYLAWGGGSGSTPLSAAPPPSRSSTTSQVYAPSPPCFAPSSRFLRSVCLRKLGF